jgi:hypothetical protein
MVQSSSPKEENTKVSLDRPTGWILSKTARFFCLDVSFLFFNGNVSTE